MRFMLPMLPLLAGLRAAFSPDLGYARVQSDVAEVVEHAVGLFPDWGIAVERLDAGPPEPGGDWGFAGAWELLSQLQPLLPEHEAEFGRSFIRGIQSAARMTPDHWRQMRQRRAELNAWAAGVFDRFVLPLTVL